MSAVSSIVSAPLPSGKTCATLDYSKFPTQDVACAVTSMTSSLASNTSDVFRQCCKPAPVEAYVGDCGYYCLAVEQSVADLQSCFMENGVAPGSIFCNANNTATATGTPSGMASSTASGTNGGSSGTSSAGAASGVVVPQVSKAGLGVLGMIVVSVFAGAML